MNFVIDIGNTNTVLGVFQDDTLIQEWRIQTNRHRTEDEFGILFKTLFESKGLTYADINSIVISSVVPPIMKAIEKTCHDYFNLTPLIVNKDVVRSSLEITYPRPDEIGADRIVNAVAAIRMYEAPQIIIDFGTATTFCYIDEAMSYVGGIISPGIKISMDALYNHASKLPKIELEEPENVIGQSTVEAMQSGVYYGYVAQVDGIVEQIKKTMNTEPTVIATGGLAPLIARGSKTIEHINTDLTLIGLNIIYQNQWKEKERDIE